MYRTFIEIDGSVEDVQQINTEIERETGVADFFDEETDDWRAWVEYKNGKTIILEEEA